MVEIQQPGGGGGTPITFGDPTQIPFVNALSDDFDYSDNLTWTESINQLHIGASDTQANDIVSILNQSAAAKFRIDQNGAALIQIPASDQAVALGRVHVRTGALVGPSTTQDLIIGPYVGANDIETEAGSTFRMGIGGVTSWVLGGSGGTGLYNHGFGDNVSPTAARMVVRGKTTDSTDNIFQGQDSASTVRFTIRNDGLVTVPGSIALGGGIDLGSDAQGDIYYRDGSGDLARLPIGSAGEVLTVNAGATAPEWDTASGGGTLNDAYDFGGAGSGRSITADAGAVEITVPNTENTPGLIVNQDDTTNNPPAILVTGNPKIQFSDDSNIGGFIGANVGSFNIVSLYSSTGAEGVRFNMHGGNEATYMNANVLGFGGASSPTATIQNSGGKFVMSQDTTVPDEAYGSGWDGSLEVPTKNAVYDKIETITGASGSFTTVDLKTVTVVNGLITAIV